MSYTQLFYSTSARFASQLAPASSYDTLNLIPSMWQGGGLKSVLSILDVGDTYNTNSWIPQTRRLTGSIIYDRTTDKYYKDAGGIDSSSGYIEIQALSSGQVSFAGLTSSNGILVTSGNIIATESLAWISTLQVLNLTKGSVPYTNNDSILEDSPIQYTSDTVSIVSDVYLGLYNILFENTSGIPSIYSNLQDLYIHTGQHLKIGAQKSIILDAGYYVLLTLGSLWLGPGLDDKSANLTVDASGKLVTSNGYSNADASFIVDVAGNLLCNSLKLTSLKLYKHDIMLIGDNQLNNIMRLLPITFLYNEDYPEDVNDSQYRQAGFIAEEVLKIYPLIAWYKEGRLAGLQYQRLTAYLTKGIQLLYIIIQLKLKLYDELLSKFAELLFKLQTLSDRVDLRNVYK